LIANQPESQELKEYMSIMSKKSKTKTWANDDGFETAPAPAPLPKLTKTPTKTQNIEKEKKNTVLSEEDNNKNKKLIQVINKKPGGQGQLLTKVHVTFSDDEKSDDETEQGEEDDCESIEQVDDQEMSTDNQQKPSAMSDLDYLKSKQVLEENEEPELKESVVDASLLKVLLRVSRQRPRAMDVLTHE
jgi:hypothetical protein